MAPTGSKFKLGLCQTHVSKDKTVSLENAKAAVEKAVSQGAELVVLGEMFSCPYATKYFREYGERLADGNSKCPSVNLLSTLARENKIWLVGGSVPELDGDNVYNTCLVFNPEGSIVAKHRKVHLFDIDVAATETRPAMKFKESDVLSAGEQATLVELPWCSAGIGICYDVRFPEYALTLRNRGAKLFIYPGAFNMTTGPAHWSVLVRGRAVDTQAFVAMASPARSTDPSDYQAWGHSMVSSPWADVMIEAEHEAGVWVVEIDPSEADRVRGQVPTSSQKRGDLYTPYADGDDVASKGPKRAKTEHGHEEGHGHAEHGHKEGCCDGHTHHDGHKDHGHGEHGHDGHKDHGHDDHGHKEHGDKGSCECGEDHGHVEKGHGHAEEGHGHKEDGHKEHGHD